MESLRQFLKQNYPVSDQELTIILAQFSEQKIEKGKFYIRQGQVAEKMGFIESGLIRIYAESGEKEVTQWVSVPGYFITELSSFVFAKPSRLHLRALEDTVIWSISKQAHQELCNSLPVWNELDKKFIAKCFVMLEDRIFSHLYMTAEERFKMLMDDQPTLFNRVPLQYLASMLGMTPETLSRMRKKT